MNTRILIFLIFLLGSGMVIAQPNTHYEMDGDKISLTSEGASHLASLPLHCMQQEYPYKTGVTFIDSSLIQAPINYHPAFYGCFDWHSSVHGHWMLVRLLKLFPTLPEEAEIRAKLTENLSAENIAIEVNVFKGLNKSFERTYGWAWLLQLQAELLSWEDPLGKSLSRNLQPLADLLVQSYREYLPKMNYAIRVGEHSNLAFGLRLAYDYAAQVGHAPLKDIIVETAMRFYAADSDCPIGWEPGGSDFLSPCLEEADLMWRILSPVAYRKWLRKFLPAITKKSFQLVPGTVSDRSDGKLVHLDGLNLSRAWCLYGIARHAGRNESRLFAVAKLHLATALPHVASGDYMGEHWLASFAVYALTAQERAE